MTDEAAFIAAILADPADDTARLVYADWLDEHGERPARAEFIRVQIEIERLRPPRQISSHGAIVDVPLDGTETHGLRAPGRGAPHLLPSERNAVYVRIWRSHLGARLPQPGDVIDLVTGNLVRDGESVKLLGLLVESASEYAESDAVEMKLYTGRDHYPDRSRLSELRRRERVLLCNHPAAFYWGLPPSLDRTHPHRDVPTHDPAIRCHGKGVRELTVTFRRGFADEVACEAGDWCRHADEIRAACPIARVRLRDVAEFEQLTIAPILGDEVYYRVAGENVQVPRDATPEKVLAARWPGVEFESL